MHYFPCLFLPLLAAALRVFNDVHYDFLDGVPKGGLCRWDFSRPPVTDPLHDGRPGTIVYTGGFGQGIGNVLAGLDVAVRLAVYTKRELIVEYELANQPLDRFFLPQASGPSWTNRSHAACSYHAEEYDFRAPAPRTAQELLRVLQSDEFPVACLKGNSGPADLEQLLARTTLASMPSGCPLSLLFDTSGHKASDELVVAGHLRLGDAFLAGGGDHHDQGRAVLVDKKWGFGTPKIAGEQFLHCLLGLSRRLVHNGAAKGKKCVVKLMSDSQHAKDAALQVVAALPHDEPCEVRVSSGIAKHSAVHSGHDVAEAVANDFLDLAAADYALLTQSGFGEVAAGMGAAPRGQAYQIIDSYLQPFSETQAKSIAQLSADELSFQNLCYARSPIPI